MPGLSEAGQGVFLHEKQEIHNGWNSTGPVCEKQRYLGPIGMAKLHPAGAVNSGRTGPSKTLDFLARSAYNTGSQSCHAGQGKLF